MSLFAGIGWLDDGAVVLDGFVPANFSGGVFGFTGGDFDEIRLRAPQGQMTGFDSCVVAPALRCNDLWIDEVRLADDPRLLPAPPGVALCALGLGLLALQRRRAVQAERGGTTP